jgi:hypothetical protein
LHVYFQLEQLFTKRAQSVVRNNKNNFVLHEFVSAIETRGTGGKGTTVEENDHRQIGGGIDL